MSIEEAAKKRRDELYRERSILANKKTEQNNLTQGTKRTRDQKSNGIKEIAHKEIARINTRMKEIDDELNLFIKNEGKRRQIIFRQVLKEIFTPAQMAAVDTEVQNRFEGCNSQKVVISIIQDPNMKDLASKFKQLAKDQIDKMIAARGVVDDVFEEGCRQFDKGYFLKVVSPINRALPPVIELRKLKQVNNIA